jgi:hypothetical protein
MFFNIRKPSVLLPLICLLIFGSQFTPAQDKNWREISQADLQQKTPKVEADADAEALFWEVRIDDSSENDLKKFTYVRVKIFTERGRERFSKFDIPFAKGLKIKDLAARIIKPDGTIVELRQDEIFEREIIRANGVKIKAKSFAVPNIEMGTIIEYRYREIFKDAGAVGMRLVFQKDIPVQTLSYYYKPSNSKSSPNYQPYNFTDTRFVKDEKGFWLAQRTNVPAYKEEPNMPPEDQVLPWMLIQGIGLRIVGASSNSISFVVKNPNNMQQYWGAVSTEKAIYPRYFNKENKDIKKLAEQVTAGATTTDEKLRKIYEYCQTQIKNLTYDTTLTDEQRDKIPQAKSLNETVKKAAGMNYEINWLFAAMANAIGFEARIAYSADRSDIFFEPEMTSDYFIHQAGIAIRIGEEVKFFDPGSPFLPYGMLVWWEEGVWAMNIAENNYIWTKTPMTGVDKTVARRTGKFKLLEDGTLEGDVRIEYSGHLGYTFKINNYDESPNKREEILIESIKKQMSMAEVSAIGIENVTDPNKPFVYTYKIRVPNYAQKTGKRLFLQPGFFEYGSPALFSSGTRKYDMYFNYPWAERDSIEIRLPDGYTLDNADSPAMIADPQKIGKLEIKIGIAKETNTLVYERHFYFGNGEKIVFPVAAYQPVKNLFDAFNKADSHTITLKQN